MEEYYKDLISKTSNPVFKEYYNSMLNYYKRGEKPLIKNFKFKIGIDKVYSEELDRYFDSMSQASIYVGKGRSYTRRCIIGELENKYKFKIV